MNMCGFLKTPHEWSGMFLTNDGFTREIDGREVDVPDSMAIKYSNSINSVIYFALLPYGLNDPAVNKRYLGDKNIKGKDYHKIQITFDQEGGGEDFEDIFVYWINVENYTIDYLAYKYSTDGGGMRFREALNERYIEGVRFADYINYKAPKSGLPADSDDIFLNGKLKELSRIELEDIKVNKL